MSNFELAKKYFFDGLSSIKVENFLQAEYQLKQSLFYVPDRSSTLTNLSLAQLKLKKLSDAKVNASKAISLEPENSEAYLNLGLIERELKNPLSSLEYFQYALNLNPNHHEAWSNRGNVLHELWRYDEALVHFDNALGINPDYHEAWINKGVTLHELKRYEDAVVHFNKAIKLRPDFYQAYWNKSITLLHLGNYQDGWPLFEKRWELASLKYSDRQYPQPRWLGHESLRNKCILIWSEQGLGDTIQFCRYIKNLSELGARVILEVQKPLLESLRTLVGVTEIIEHGDRSPLFDFHCPLMSLPLAFKTSLKTIPSNIPYISPDPIKVAYWKKKIGSQKLLKVGLVWSSGYREDEVEFWRASEKKDIPLQMLSKLNIPKIQFYSLQKGEKAEYQLLNLESHFWEGPKIVNYSNGLQDFSDTAALIQNLDIIISVDTSVAHMAGAMGKPTWILSQFAVDWRWSKGQKELWYPTSTVFEQACHGDWDSVVNQVKSRLIKISAELN